MDPKEIEARRATTYTRIRTATSNAVSGQSSVPPRGVVKSVSGDLT